MPEYEAILLFSFGGPESKEDVIPFLQNVTAGKPVPLERLKEVQAQYDLFDGISPLNQQNRELIIAIEEELTRHGLELPIYFGNRNWVPFLQDTVNQIVEDGHRKVLALVTSAFGSYSGCKQYQQDIGTAVKNAQADDLVIDKVRLFWNHPKFFSAVAAQIEKVLSSIETPRREKTKLVFTAHSIPEAWAETSPYTSQLTSISQELSTRIAPDLNWDLVYQSRSGPPSVPWLEPDIVDYIDLLDTNKVDTLVVVPIGFLSDHMEVKFDLDMQAAGSARDRGIEMLRVSTVGVNKTFVSMIRELIQEAIFEDEPAVEFGEPWKCTPTCCAITESSNARIRGSEN
ncbi:MAG: ferrochelatase [Acidimicrobiaceae bacterium]|nr:ferrochelatase [Acidimicrobiaceae bacterium]|tara:strand:+ start:1363 stop:2391 length:1029 start_codon:yes stop_codon:yes gene_type:complete